MAEEQVFRLKVAMYDPLFVRRRQPVGKLAGIIERLAGRKRTCGEPGAQRLPFQ